MIESDLSPVASLELCRKPHAGAVVITVLIAQHDSPGGGRCRQAAVVHIAADPHSEAAQFGEYFGVLGVEVESNDSSRPLGTQDLGRQFLKTPVCLNEERLDLRRILIIPPVDAEG